MTTHSDIGLLSFLVRINMYCLRIAEPPIYFYTFPTCKNPKLFFYFFTDKGMHWNFCDEAVVTIYDHEWQTFIVLRICRYKAFKAACTYKIRTPF